MAVITQLNLEERYGFITDQEGRDIYFSGNNLIGHKFEELALGMPVVYSQLTGVDGLEAQNVSVAV